MQAGKTSLLNAAAGALQPLADAQVCRIDAVAMPCACEALQLHWLLEDAFHHHVAFWGLDVPRVTARGIDSEDRNRGLPVRAEVKCLHW